MRYVTLCLVVAIASCTESTTPRTSLVQTQSGAVQGEADGELYTYFGVPYAAPPVGSLRWKPPEPIAPWTGVLQTAVPQVPAFEGAPAIIPVPKCPQSLTGGDLAAPFLGPVDEDCLYINVVTPKEGNDLPVMVWIHGGGFVLGEGVQTDGGTSGTKLAEAENVVLVSMNYRLGPFGFLAHEALTAESENDASSNYGLMDQVAALQWVQENIRAFGGNPDNVTIFGESAGAFSTCALMTSPRAAGLFHRAILQSGSCERPWPTLAAAHAQGERFAALVGCDTERDVLGCMRGKSWEELHEAWAPTQEESGLIGFEASLIDLEGRYLQWTPILDGYFFEEQSTLSTANGTFNQVPLMIGFTREEGRLFGWLAEDETVGAGVDITEDNYPDFVAYMLGGNEALAGTAVAGPYAPGNFADPGDAFSAVATDVLFRCPSLAQATSASSHVPTYVYEFRYRDADFALDEVPVLPSLDRSQFQGWSDGAFHSADIQYVFGVPMLPSKSEFQRGSVDDELWRTMRAYWARFARTGDPNGDGAEAWPAFDGDDPEFLVLDTEVETASDGPTDACAFWEGTDYLVPSFTDGN
ncbi:MAG: carboxylesterase family protein [Myxococcales bacterium]|nr:carboxylesterase family protein [Myxococcales bacterium]